MNNKIMNIMLVLWLVSLIGLAVVSNLAQQDIDKSRVEKKQNF